jgi:hypothetical protein
VNRRRLVVVGTLASMPWAGMAWMHMQIVVGLLRLGHDVYYLETTSAWPYDPRRRTRVGDSDHAVAYLARVAGTFGIPNRWAYRRTYADKGWLGPVRDRAVELLATADAVFNVAGATRFAEEGLKIGRLVYLGTDPVVHEIEVANGDQQITSLIAEHDDVVTYGENIGTSRCPVPPLPRLRTRMRQPVLVDLWDGAASARPVFTTVCNWKQIGHEAQFGGETYHWSKHHEFLKFVEAPRRTGAALEIALGLADLEPETRRLLQAHGWRLADAHAFTLDAWSYRDYVVASRGEFTVAKDLNVRLRSGWFSERSACYLAAGRPVITQETGFGDVLPTGKGLFAFKTMEEIVVAAEAIQADYRAHSMAAREIARDFFRAEGVLVRLLGDLGL